QPRHGRRGDARGLQGRGPGGRRGRRCGPGPQGGAAAPAGGGEGLVWRVESSLTGKLTPRSSEKDVVSHQKFVNEFLIRDSSRRGPMETTLAACRVPGSRSDRCRR